MDTPSYDALQAYATKASASEPPLLVALRHATTHRLASARMLLTPLQGRFLALLARLHKPKRILEIGTYTGYSALCLAEGLPAGGILHTVDRNSTTTAMAQRYFAQAGHGESIHCHVGEAQEVITSLKGTFDMVFLDADKQGYATYYNLLIDRLTPGALLVADNLFWRGATVAEDPQDRRAVALQAFAVQLRKDPRVITLCLPLGDGLLVALRQ